MKLLIAIVITIDLVWLNWAMISILPAITQLQDSELERRKEKTEAT